MYNKVLKRPMFNMGGRINQAAGTGITSGLDTPRMNYDKGSDGNGVRSRAEIEAEILALYPEKTPQQKGFDILESYGNLPSAYKDGEYRTIGERLDMRSASYEKKLAEEVALQNKAKLAVLESDMAKNTADDLAANALERTIAGQSDNLGNSLPYARQLFNETNRLSKMLENPQFGPTKAFVTANLNSIAKANVDIAKLQAEGSGDNLMTIPESAYVLQDGAWKFNPKNLIPGLVYFDVVTRQYVVPTSTTTSMKYPTYEEANAALQEGPIKKTEIKKKDIVPTEDSNNIKLISTHPTNEAGEITEDYLLEYADNNKIVFDSETYKAQGGASEGYKLISKIVLKKRLENENVKSQKDEKNKIAKDDRLKSDALKYFAKKRGDKTYYELIMEGSLTMPSRFEPFIDEYTETITVAEAPVATMAAGGRVGYAMGSPEFQGEVVTEELEEIQPDTSVDELADLQTWWKSEIEKDFNA